MTRWALNPSLAVEPCHHRYLLACEYPFLPSSIDHLLDLSKVSLFERYHCPFKPKRRRPRRKRRRCASTSPGWCVFAVAAGPDSALVVGMDGLKIGDVDGFGNDAGYGSETGYGGDEEVGYGDEADEEEKDGRENFWGEIVGGISCTKPPTPGFSYLF